ncbi:MAG: STAS domain-containing protein [Blastococcus sp.]
MSAPPTRHSPSPPSLVVRIDVHSGVLCLSGELLGATVHLLDDAITTLLLTGRRHWHADVTDLLVWDTAGLRAIAEASRRTQEHDCRIILVGASPRFRRTLASLNLDHEPFGDASS